MAVRILAIGRKHEAWIAEGVRRYETRLLKPFNTEWVLLPHSARESRVACEEESYRLLKRIRDDDFVILLDETGKIINSPALSKLLLVPLQTSKNVVMIIGGAYGVDERVRTRANFVWSLSLLVFPHQLVRLLLAEQLYRAQEIAANNPYHHE